MFVKVLHVSYDERFGGTWRGKLETSSYRSRGKELAKMIITSPVIPNWTLERVSFLFREDIESIKRVLKFKAQL